MTTLTTLLQKEMIPESDKALKEAAENYLKMKFEYNHNAAVKQMAERNMKLAEEDMQRHERVLVGSVEPKCGSATKPHRRIFAFPKFPNNVVVVEWSKEKDQGVVNVEALL